MNTCEDYIIKKVDKIQEKINEMDGRLIEIETSMRIIKNAILGLSGLISTVIMKIFGVV